MEFALTPPKTPINREITRLGWSKRSAFGFFFEFSLKKMLHAVSSFAISQILRQI